jgi:superfamily I DNA/RNA helicase
MNAVELGRQAAARLHAEAVAAGADPQAPLALVSRVAASLGIALEDVAPNAPQLQGAQAVYDPNTRTIFYPAGADPFWAAFLIGHELGHVNLGDADAPDQATAVEPARAAEAAPIGEERVLDYSRRSRREVQMDLFARELILPRDTARRRHVEAGESASVIAATLGAPFEVVAQQLLDALLLPPLTAAPAEARPERPLNPEQAAAARHTGGPYVLEAGPGTGKTQTLAARVQFLVQRPEQPVDPRSILVLTFSNKAAGELADRIAVKTPEAAVAAWIGTFHGFGYDLLKTYHARLGFERAPVLMDRTEAIELLELEVSQLGLDHYRDLWDPTENLRAILGAVSRAQDEVADADAYLRCAEAMQTRDPEAAAKAAEVARVYRRYQEIKRSRGAVDFGDLVMMPVQLLRDHPDVRAELQERFRHILVDEYQVVNRSSVELLKLLIGPERDLWVVGDARQAIYRFRGASSFNMARFDKLDFAPAARGRLQINYRSRQEVVDAFGDFGAGMQVGAGGDGGRLTAERGLGGVAPAHWTVGTKDEEGAGAARAIEEARQAGISYSRQAVLCSGNERLARIGEDLERRGIPVLFLGSLFERPEIKDLLAWLTLLVDRRAMSLVRQKSPWGLNLSLADAAAVISELKAAEAAPLAWRTHSFGRLSDEAARKLGEIAVALDGFGADAAPWDVLAHLLLDRSRVLADLAQEGTVTSRAQAAAIWQFLNFLRVQPRGQGLPIRRLLDRIRRLVRLADDRELRQLPEAAQSIEAVRLMTIHGSKGLEFDAVHVLGLNQQSLPRTGGPPPKCPPPDGLIIGAEGSGRDFVDQANREEQECLFYVALSRARDRLTLHSVRRRSDGGSRAASSYLARIGGLTRRDLDLAAEVLPDEDAAPLPVRLAAPLVLSLAHLEAYRRCPRRFLYTYVLEIGGRRSGSAFTDMHSVVQATLADLCATPDTDAEAVYAAAWSGAEVASHAFAEDYRRIGRDLIEAFLRSRGGRSPAESFDLQHTAPDGEVCIRPDEVLSDPSGARVARRVRTGKRPSADNRVGEEAFALAVRNAGPGVSAELVYLADGDEPVPLVFKDAVLARKAEAIAQSLADLAAGRFPLKESERTCPSCPAFFVCGRVAEGDLEKKLDADFPDRGG